MRRYLAGVLLRVAHGHDARERDEVGADAAEGRQGEGLVAPEVPYGQGNDVENQALADGEERGGQREGKAEIEGVQELGERVEPQHRQEDGHEGVKHLEGEGRNEPVAHRHEHDQRHDDHRGDEAHGHRVGALARDVGVAVPVVGVAVVGVAVVRFVVVRVAVAFEVLPCVAVVVRAVLGVAMAAVLLLRMAVAVAAVRVPRYER
mmetsp:Transcript_102204/g.284670  ORF Transcript_102204/g.284670 Transcript_102204/m.284670 type:complete len:205 (-) Transcript_102204:214-828(-)